MSLPNLDLPGDPTIHRVVVAMSGGVELVGDRGPAGRGRV